MARRRRKLYEVPGRVILSRPLAASKLEDIVLQGDNMNVFKRNILMAAVAEASGGGAGAAAVSHPLSHRSVPCLV